MVSRRDATALLGTLGLGAVSAPSWNTAEAGEGYTLPADPAAQNDAQVRILGRTDDGESVWQSSSRIFALTDEGGNASVKNTGWSEVLVEKRR